MIQHKIPKGKVTWNVPGTVPFLSSSDYYTLGGLSTSTLLLLFVPVKSTEKMNLRGIPSLKLI